MASKTRYTAAIVGLAWVILYFGWREFWFLTDDAFIAFRYVQNSLLGFGYTWNPPPFRPVDGYTSWSWVFLLDVVWRLTGFEPPETANWLSLGAAAVTIALLVMLALDTTAACRSRGVRGFLVAFVLIATLSNRTFLAWTSSGLETALYGLTVMWWVYEGRRVGRGEMERTIPWTLAVVAAGVTRPDALPLCGLTLMVLCWQRLTRRHIDTTNAALMCWFTLLGAFFVWKRWRYGSFLPNTYHAKVHGSWPEAGSRFLGSFVLEYALWIWVAVVPWAFVSKLRRGWRPDLPLLAAIAGIGYQVAYYAIVVGGDHFEFKAYYHVVPLLYLSFAWAIVHGIIVRAEKGPERERNRQRDSERDGERDRPRRVAAGVLLCLAFLACGWVIPWTHHLQSRTLKTRPETFQLRVAVAPLLPAPLQWYARPFDTWQSWLIERFVCMRHQEHAVFYEFKRDTLPPREEGMKIGPQGNPVHVAGEAGVAGWRLPHAIFIDSFGLNDYYIARSKHKAKVRRMAHERVAPHGYVQSFSPNVDLVGRHWKVRKRKVPLLDADIRRIEQAQDLALEAAEAKETAKDAKAKETAKDAKAKETAKDAKAKETAREAAKKK